MSNAIVQILPPEKVGKMSLIRAKLAGTLAPEDMKLLTAWAEGLNTAIKEASNGFVQSVLILIDIHGFETYTDASVLTILSELMKKDNPYVCRTATCGGTSADEMIEEVIEGMVNRTNLKNFPTEKEALAWLTS